MVVVLIQKHLVSWFLPMCVENKKNKNKLRCADTGSVRFRQNTNICIKKWRNLTTHIKSAQIPNLIVSYTNKMKRLLKVR